MEIKKKILSILIVLAMILTMAPKVPVMAMEGTEIPAKVFSTSWNEQYDILYYTEDTSYTYQGKEVTFVDEESIKIEGEDFTRPIKNKQITVDVSIVEDDVTITYVGVDTPVSQIPGEWNSSYAGDVHLAYEGGSLGSVVSFSNNKSTIELKDVPEGEYTLTNGTIFEKANQWSPGTDFGEGTVTERNFGVLPNVIFSIKGEENAGEYLGTFIDANVPEDFIHDLWLQYDFREMNIGETANLYPRRVEQAVTDVINNDVERPNFNFQIIRGDSISLSTTSSTNKTIVTAVKEGDTVVKVTYDAFDHSKGKHFPASSPVNTAYVVYSVGGSDNMTIASGITQRSYDTIYYKDGETVDFTFSPIVEGAETVEVTCNGLVLTDDNGSYTAPLENRSNIIGIVAISDAGEKKSLYRVVDARKISINVANKTHPGEDLKSGDTANISFTGITMPVYKLASIYNPQWTNSWGGVQNYSTHVKYENNLLGTFRGLCQQWDLATNNDFDVEFIQGGEYLFEGKGIPSTWWGSNLGSDKGGEGQGEPNLNAPTNSDTFSTLPNFTVTVLEGTPATSIEINKENATLKLDETMNLTATVLPEETTNKKVIWSTSDENVVSVTQEGVIKGITPGSSATITATCGGVTDTCLVTVSSINTDEIIQAIDQLPEITDMNYSHIKVIKAINKKYELLSDAEKSQVKNSPKLLAAIGYLSTLENMLAFTIVDSKGEELSFVEIDEKTWDILIPEGIETITVNRFKDMTIWNKEKNVVLAQEGDTNVNISVGEEGFHVVYDGNTYHLNFVRKGLAVDKDYVTIMTDGSTMLNAKGVPSEVELIWTSSDTEVATVSSEGEVVGMSEGVAQISVSDGENTATCQVTVKPREGTIEFPVQVSPKTVYPGEEVTVSIEGLTVPSEVTPPIHSIYSKFQTTIPNLENIVSVNGRENIGTITFTVPNGIAPGEYQIFDGKVIAEYGGFKIQGMFWVNKTTKSFYTHKFETQSIRVGDKVLDKAKIEAVAEINNYKNDDDFRDKERALLEVAKNNGELEVGKAKTVEDVANALVLAKEVMDSIKTDAQLTEEELEVAKAMAGETLDNYEETKELPQAIKEAVEKAIIEGKEDIEGTTLIEEVENIVVETKLAIDGLVSGPITYEILEGDKGSLLEGENKEYTLKSKGSIERFISFSLDGKVVDPENYVLSEGSTIVTLKGEYVAKLEKGEHTFTYKFNNGSSNGIFTVVGAAGTIKDSPSKSVKTGDDGVKRAGILLMLAIVAMIVSRRKNCL